MSSVCLITKDPQREYKDLLESHGIRFISRVVGIEKLKGKFKPFEARRMLLKENDLFLADERVVPLLPGLLGKKFFEAKKYVQHTCYVWFYLTIRAAGSLSRCVLRGRTSRVSWSVQSRLPTSTKIRAHARMSYHICDTGRP